MFENLPLDEDTKILSREIIQIGEITAMSETWQWEGLVCKSLIIPNAFVAHFNDQRILELINQSYPLQGKSTVKKGKSYVFVTYDCRDVLDDASWA